DRIGEARHLSGEVASGRPSRSESVAPLELPLSLALAHESERLAGGSTCACALSTATQSSSPTAFQSSWMAIASASRPERTKLNASKTPNRSIVRPTPDRKLGGTKKKYFLMRSAYRDGVAAGTGVAP